MKLLLVFGTRPEAVKMFPVARAVAALPGATVRVCVTGQHRELLDQVLAVAELRADIDLRIMEPGQSLDVLLGRLTAAVGEVIDREQPDRVLVQGDTASALAAATAAYHRRVAVGHVEAGLRSGNLHHPWPEEGYRRMIAQVADLHFAPTPGAAAALEAENVRTGVHVTGNTVVDALRWARASVAEQPALASGLDGVAAQAAGRRIVLVTMHRRENLGAGTEGVAQALVRLADRPDVFLLLPLHPNPHIRQAVEIALRGRSNAAIVEPLDYAHFVRALDLSHLVLTDSGGVQEEAPAMGRPVLVLRETTERPEGIAAGTARLVGTDEERVFQEASCLLDDERAHAAMAQAHNPFGDGLAARRISAILAAAHGIDGPPRCPPWPPEPP